MKCVFWLSLQLLSEKFLILRRTERDIVINVHGFSCKERGTRYLCEVLMKLELCWQIFWKIKYKNFMNQEYNTNIRAVDCTDKTW
jgi:hypothetical protein